MRIATWNLDNRPLTGRRLELLLQQRCDVWLLTEVRPGVVVPGFHVHLSRQVMARGQHWAAVLSRQELTPLPDPHAASAAALVGDITFCASVLPWRGARAAAPWVGQKHEEKTQNAIRCLLDMLPRTGLVWGGDWNHGLLGREWAGSRGGREHLLKAIEKLSLNVPTAELMAQKDRCHSIDHVAVPKEWKLKGKAEQIRVDGLSDHDAYVIEVNSSSV